MADGSGSGRREVSIGRLVGIGRRMVEEGLPSCGRREAMIHSDVDRR